VTPPPPPMWTTLAQFWGLEERQARRAWSALYQAKWSTAASWTQALVYFESQVPALRAARRRR
jgi:hypothetical protein